MPKAPPSRLQLKPELPTGRLRSFKGCLNCRLLRKGCPGPLNNQSGCQTCRDRRRTCLGFPNTPVTRTPSDPYYEAKERCSRYMRDWNTWLNAPTSQMPEVPIMISNDGVWLDLREFEYLMSLPTGNPSSPSSSAASTSFTLPTPSPLSSASDLYDGPYTEEPQQSNSQETIMPGEPHMWTNQSTSFGVSSSSQMLPEIGSYGMAQHPAFVPSNDQQASFVNSFPSYWQAGGENAQEVQYAQFLGGPSSLSFPSSQQEYASSPNPLTQSAGYPVFSNSSINSGRVEGYPPRSGNLRNPPEGTQSHFTHTDAMTPQLFVTDHNPGLNFTSLSNAHIAHQAQPGYYDDGRGPHLAFPLPSPFHQDAILYPSAEAMNQTMPDTPAPFDPNSSFAPYEGLPPLPARTDGEQLGGMTDIPMQWDYSTPVPTSVPSNAPFSNVGGPIDVDSLFNSPTGSASTHATVSIAPITAGGLHHQDYPPPSLEVHETSSQPSITSRATRRPRGSTPIASDTASSQSLPIDTEATTRTDSNVDPNLWREEHRRRNGSLPSVLYTLEERDQVYYWDGDAIRRKHAGE